MNDAFFRQIADALSPIHDVIAAYVIGSAAAGRQRSDSDFDLVVVVDSKRPRDEEEIYDKLRHISFPRNLDLSVVDTSSSPLFLFQIIKTGKLIFHKNNRDVVAFESFAMRNYYDTAYFRNIYNQEVASRFRLSNP